MRLKSDSGCMTIGFAVLLKISKNVTKKWWFLMSFWRNEFLKILTNCSDLMATNKKSTVPIVLKFIWCVKRSFKKPLCFNFQASLFVGFCEEWFWRFRAWIFIGNFPAGFWQDVFPAHSFAENFNSPSASPFFFGGKFKFTDLQLEISKNYLHDVFC